MERKQIITRSIIGFLGGLGIFLIYNKIVKNKTYAALIANANMGVNESGTIEDLRTTAFSAGFYKGKPAKSLYTIAVIDKLAVDIHDNINDKLGIPWTSNEDRVVSLFSSFLTKAQVSQTTEYYNKKFNTDLLKDVEHMGSDHIEAVKAIVQSLPNG